MTTSGIDRLSIPEFYGQGRPISPLSPKGPYSNIKKYLAKIKKMRNELSAIAVISPELEEAARQIDQHLYAAQVTADELCPVLCCQGKPEGGATDCPACYGDRVTTRAKRRHALGT